MTIRRMTIKELHNVLDWVRREGWNPGLDDAAPFYAADPQGYFVNEVAGKVAAAISVVNHSDEFAFLGLYICLPEYRGQGHGSALWSAAIAHAGQRNIGLDGVEDQQSNYRKSGFVLTGKTVRYQGILPSASEPVTRCKADLEALLALDKRITGVSRPDFARGWFTDTPSRKTFSLRDRSGPIRAFATARKCHEGLKIGPLWSEDLNSVEALLRAIVDEFGVQQAQIDVPGGSEGLAAHFSALGFRPVFRTARMYKGPPPQAQPGAFYTPATLELG